jgi:hypothetical protein
MSAKFWSKGRVPREENINAKVAGGVPSAGRLTAVDRCDRCGAQAYIRAVLPSQLELLFCAHHGRKHASALATVAAEIQDETARLAHLTAATC